jgi:TP901 family phage tail tape measure protein
MTETAVVTEFSIGDMWEKLPDYAAHANNLGASIKDVYAATTLYYQQGLKTNEAMSVGVETMKMARIAGMDAANATEAMTAALRGFNMEVNETNAVRVNDVYSELAAVTAADTEQIATAMSKTASIAASANMEFETTAALLAQIIETTQEAPETAGTAMKTIIARFSEVKKLRSEMKTTGEDEEGEVIDVNKIQGALRSVGISMDDFFAGTEGLDSILLKLAEKWKTLDFETQRYIATTAAGSRQQSRFIAMMSDYERTMELATAANNSAGASQEQFDKTLESMEAKL